MTKGTAAMQYALPASLFRRRHYIVSTCSDLSLMCLLVAKRHFAQQRKRCVSLRAARLRRGSFLQTHSLTYDSLQGNS